MSGTPSMRTKVEPGQVWKSLRTGKKVRVLKIKDFGSPVGTAALIEHLSGVPTQTWLTIVAKGITGYTLKEG